MVAVGFLFQQGLAIENYGFGFTATVFGYPLLAASFGLLTAAALCPNSALDRLRIPGAQSIALWSYALYLSHKPIAMILRRVWLDNTAAAERPIAIAAIVAACLAGGVLLHYSVERPFLGLRRRICPTIFAAAENEGDDTCLVPAPSTMEQ